MQEWSVVALICPVWGVVDSGKALGGKPKYSYQVYRVNSSNFASKWFCRMQAYTYNI